MKGKWINILAASETKRKLKHTRIMWWNNNIWGRFVA
jgi:hypothetical protein